MWVVFRGRIVKTGAIDDSVLVARRRCLRFKSEEISLRSLRLYSTVTLFARLRGWSTSVPLATAAW